MGMYTELVFIAQVREDTPERVRDILKFLFAQGDDIEAEAIPSHDFFKCSRWFMVGGGGSFYFTPFATSEMRTTQNCTHIASRSDFKNYDDEIDLFIDWVSPYLEGCKDACVGWKLYEEDRVPTLLFL